MGSYPVDEKTKTSRYVKNEGGVCSDAAPLFHETDRLVIMVMGKMENEEWA
jgi:hypothetical protein